MRNEKTQMYLFGIVFFALLLYIFNSIYHFPVKGEEGQKKKEKEKYDIPLSNPKAERDRQIAKAIELDFENAKEKYEVLEKVFTRFPRFRPPSNNHLTEDQIHRHYTVVEHCVKARREFAERYVKGKRLGFIGAVALYGYVPELFALCRAQGFVKAKIGEDEFEWVSKRLWEVALFAVNIKWRAKDFNSPEEKERLKRIRDKLSEMNGLYESDKEGKWIFHPERLNTKNIPRHNVELFLKLKDEVRWEDVNFRYITFDNEAILKEAQRLPE